MPGEQSFNLFLDSLDNKNWREHCRSNPRAQKLQAGATYLSQLLAHDMFMTEPVQNVFTKSNIGAYVTSNTNLVNAPLMLGTIYGRTGSADQPLYNESDLKSFDLIMFPRYDKYLESPKFQRDPRKQWSYPVLADARNYSTPILTQITHSFMAYHNRLVQAFRKQNADEANIFALARINVVRTWHKIIQNDIIDVTCRDAAHMPGSMPDDDILSQSEYMSLGALRSFHALVRDDYVFNKTTVEAGPPFETIESLLSANVRGPAVGSEHSHGTHQSDFRTEVAAWLDRWKADWPKFFDDPSRGEAAFNRTGFTPSFNFQRPDRITNALNSIQQLDARKAEHLNQEELLQQSSVAEGINSLLAELKEWGVSTDTVQINKIPMPIALLAEGYYDQNCEDSDLGKLGPVGSTIIRCQLENALESAAERVDSIVDDTFGDTGMPDREDLPKNFVEMTKTNYLTL